jgi:hypothetical protein
MSAGHGDKLSRQQEAAIAALLAEPTIGKAAAVAGVNEKTLRRWLASGTAFLAAYRDARRQLFESAIGRLQQVSGKAVDTLERNLIAGKPADQVRAAVAILGLARDGMATIDVVERIEALEPKLAGRQAGSAFGTLPTLPDGIHNTNGHPL